MVVSDTQDIHTAEFMHWIATKTCRVITLCSNLFMLQESLWILANLLGENLWILLNSYVMYPTHFTRIYLDSRKTYGRISARMDSRILAKFLALCTTLHIGSLHSNAIVLPAPCLTVAKELYINKPVSYCLLSQGNYATQDCCDMCHLMPWWHLPE